MLLHESTPATVMNRYSTRYVLLLAVVAALWFMLLGALRLSFGNLLNLPRAYMMPQAIVGSGSIAIALGIFWLLVPVSSSESGPTLFRIFIATVFIVASGWWVSDPALLISRRAILLIATTAIVIALTGVMLLLTKTPPAGYLDEAVVSLFGWNWVRSGSTDLPNMLIPNRYLQVSSLASYLLGIWLNILPTTFEAGRAWAVGMALLSAPIIYHITRKILTPGVSLLLIGSMIPVFMVCSYIRNDVLVPLVLTAALGIYYYAGERFWWHVAVGFTFAMTIEGHQLAIRFAIVMGALYFYTYCRIIWREHRWWYAPFWGLVAGGILYGVVYLGSRLLIWNMSLPQLLGELTIAYSRESMIGGGTTVLTLLSEGISSWFGTILLFHPATVLIVILATVLSVRLRDRWLTFLTILWWGSSVLHIILNPKPLELIQVYYTMHMLPIVVLLLGSVAGYCIKHYGLPSTALMLVMLGIMNMSQAVIVGRATGHRDLIEMGYTINQRLSPDVQVVSASENLWWGLKERTFYLIYSFTDSAGPLEQVLNRYKAQPIDALILISGVDIQSMIPLYIEKNDLVRSFCLPSKGFGTVTVYVVRSLALEYDTGC